MMAIAALCYVFFLNSATISSSTLRLCSSSSSLREIQSTQQWIKEFVVGLGICPYASKPFLSSQIKYVVSNATTVSMLTSDFFSQSEFLLDSSIETTMLICSSYKGDVEEFYSLYSDLSDDIEANEFAIQPAFFHPHWRFAGLSRSDPVNFEKRAPYPTINLLRRSSLDKVITAAFSERGVLLDEEMQAHNTLALENEGYQSLKQLFKSFH